jgi:hypothetical protein
MTNLLRTIAIIASLTACGTIEDAQDWDQNIDQEESSLREASTTSSSSSTASSGDLCPNQETASTVCVGAARCRCGQGADAFTYLDPTGACNHPDGPCAANPVNTRKEACAAARGDVAEPAECNDPGTYPPVCISSGVTGPNTKKSGKCCTATKVRGCARASEDLSRLE